MAHMTVETGDYLRAFKYLLDDRYYQPKIGELVCVQTREDCSMAKADNVLPVIDKTTLKPVSYIVNPVKLAVEHNAQSRIRVLGVCLGISDGVTYTLVRDNKVVGRPPHEPNVHVYNVGFAGTCPCRVPYNYALNLRPHDDISIFLDFDGQQHPVPVGEVAFLDTFDNTLGQQHPYYIVQTLFSLPLFSSMTA